MSYEEILILSIGLVLGMAVITFVIADKFYDMLHKLQRQIDILKYRHIKQEKLVRQLESDNQHFMNRIAHFRAEQDLHRKFTEDTLLEHACAIIELEEKR